jgi:hypothetical protein
LVIEAATHRTRWRLANDPLKLVLMSLQLSVLTLQLIKIKAATLIVFEPVFLLCRNVRVCVAIVSYSTTTSTSVKAAIL